MQLHVLRKWGESGYCTRFWCILMYNGRLRPLDRKSRRSFPGYFVLSTHVLILTSQLVVVHVQRFRFKLIPRHGEVAIFVRVSSFAAFACRLVLMNFEALWLLTIDQKAVCFYHTASNREYKRYLLETRLSKYWCVLLWKVNRLACNCRLYRIDGTHDRLCMTRSGVTLHGMKGPW